jgi:hypothetical protein
MKLVTRAFFIFGIAVLPLSGCMMGMHGMDHEPSHQQPAKSIVKEFADKDVTLTLDVSPFVIGEDATLALKAYHMRRETPVSGAKVTYRIERIEKYDGEHRENHVSAAEEREADEIAGKGIYQLKYRVHEGGTYKITARLWMEGKGEAAPPLSVSLTQETDRDGNHDEASRNTWMIIGGIGMVVMMAIMIL